MVFVWALLLRRKTKGKTPLGMKILIQEADTKTIMLRGVEPHREEEIGNSYLLRAGIGNM